MARRPDVPCTICGKLLWGGLTSLPAGRRTCHACRRGRAVMKPKFEPELRLCMQCGEVYEAHRPNQQYCNVECRNARSNWGGAHANTKSSAEERGYGKAHQIVRARWKPLVEAGNVDCCLCGDPIEPGSKWHLDHTEDRTGYRGAAHAACNVRDGAIRGNRGRSF